MHPAFPAARFRRACLRGLQSLELLDRGQHIARALGSHLPPNYPEAVDVLLRSLGPEHASEELIGAGMAPFFYLPHTLFVAERGLEHFDLSMRAHYELTKRFSAESSIRPYIASEPERTFAVLREWTSGPQRSRSSPRLRRYAAASAVGGPRPLARRQPRARPRASRAAEGRPLDPGAPQRRQQPERPRKGQARPSDAHLRCLAGRRLGRAPCARRARLAQRGEARRSRRPAAPRLRREGRRRRRERGIRSAARRNRRKGIAMRFTLRSRSPEPQMLLVDLAVHFVKASGRAAPKVFKTAARRRCRRAGGWNSRPPSRSPSTPRGCRGPASTPSTSW